MASLIPPNCGFVLYETRATRRTNEFSRKQWPRRTSSQNCMAAPPKAGATRISVDWAPAPVQFTLEPALQV